jgi:hypothetical protein
MSDAPKPKRSSAAVEILKDPRAYVILAAGLVGFGISAGITMARNRAAASGHEEPSEHASNGQHEEHGGHDAPEKHASGTEHHDPHDPHAHAPASASADHRSAAPSASHDGVHHGAHGEAPSAPGTSPEASADAGRKGSSDKEISEPVVHVVGGAAYQELPDGGKVSTSISNALDAIQGVKPKPSAAPAPAKSPASALTPAAHPEPPAHPSAPAHH